MINRMVTFKVFPAAAACGLIGLRRNSETKPAFARTDFEIIEDRFQTSTFYNSYKKVQVFGFQGCPYCAKVRAYLRFRGIDFEDVEVNGITKKELKEVCPDYSQVPVVVIRDQSGEIESILKDSGVIISVLEQVFDGSPFKPHEIAKFYFNEQGKWIKKNTFTNAEEKNVDPNRKFVQDGILHTVAPNIYPSLVKSIKNSFAMQSRSEKFRDTLVGNIIALIGGFGMYFIAYFCIFRNYRENSSQTREEYLDSQVAKFLAEKGDNKFLGGENCSVADVEAWAVINLTEGTTAFPEYEKHADLMKWYRDVQKNIDLNKALK